MTMMITNEKFWCLTGTWHNDILWSARGRWPLEGESFTVSFGSIYDKVVSRESIYGDVLGFYHTHPNLPGIPSHTDISTMNQCVDAFGKPLLCLIHGQEGLQTYYWLGDGQYQSGKTFKVKNKFIGGLYEPRTKQSE